MSGFDNAKVDAAFSGNILEIEFYLQYRLRDFSKLYPRTPRLDFSEACKIL
jgi:3-hydroxypropanoate dehydrogenase